MYDWIKKWTLIELDNFFLIITVEFLIKKASFNGGILMEFEVMQGVGNDLKYDEIGRGILNIFINVDSIDNLS